MTRVNGYNCKIARAIFVSSNWLVKSGVYDWIWLLKIKVECYINERNDWKKILKSKTYIAKVKW